MYNKLMRERMFHQFSDVPPSVATPASNAASAAVETPVVIVTKTPAVRLVVARVGRFIAKFGLPGVRWSEYRGTGD